MQYLEWQVCVSREHELLTSSKKDTALSFDSSGSLKLSKSEGVEPCDVTSDLQVRYALMRRGLALEQANIMSYKNHDTWLEKLFSARLASQPAGYQRISYKPLQNSDAKLFLVLAEKTREGIKTTADGRPCDKHFSDAMNSPEVNHFLQPMPGGNDKKREIADVNGSENVEKVKKIKKKGDGKGKGPGAWKPSVPKVLLDMGCVAVTNKGNSLCFDYQLGKCSLQVSRQRCKKGLHLCAVKGCHGDHPANKCKKAEHE